MIFTAIMSFSQAVSPSYFPTKVYWEGERLIFTIIFELRSFRQRVISSPTTSSLILKSILQRLMSFRQQAEHTLQIKAVFLSFQMQSAIDRSV